MTCSVLFYHCPLLEGIQPMGSVDLVATTFIESIIKTLPCLLMSYFFMTTGFLFFRDFSMANYLSKIKSRCFSLLIPFVLWQALLAIFDTVFKYNQITLAEFLKSTFSLQRWPLISPLWYVYGIFLVTLFSPLVYLIIKRKNLGWGIIIVLIFAVEVRDKIDIPLIKSILDYGYVQNMVYYMPAYFVGAFYGYHFRDSSPKCLSYVVILLLLSFLFNNNAEGLFFNVSSKMLPLAILYLLPPVKFLENRKVYRLSFLIYALHQPFMWKTAELVHGFYTRCIYSLIPSLALVSVLMRLIYLALVIGLAALLRMLLLKLSPRFLALLTGGRA